MMIWLIISNFCLIFLYLSTTEYFDNLKMLFNLKSKVVTLSNSSLPVSKEVSLPNISVLNDDNMPSTSSIFNTSTTKAVQTVSDEVTASVITNSNSAVTSFFATNSNTSITDSVIAVSGTKSWSNYITNFFSDFILTENTLMILGLLAGSGLIYYYFFHTGWSAIDSRIYDLQKDVCEVQVKVDNVLAENYRIIQKIDVLSCNINSLRPGGFSNTWSSLFTGSGHFSTGISQTHYIDLVPLINALHSNSQSLIDIAHNSQEPFAVFFTSCITALSVLHQSLDVASSITPENLQNVTDTANVIVSGLENTLSSTGGNITIDNNLLLSNQPNHTDGMNIPNTMRQSGLFQ